MMTDKESRELEKRISGYQLRGWYPAKWAHHPKPIKTALHLIGLRPQIKGCFANCQRFVLGENSLQLGLNVVYREGWAYNLIPFEHAWLEFEGSIVDLTLDNSRDRDTCYLDSTAYTVDQIRANLVRQRVFTPVDQRELARIRPIIDKILAIENDKQRKRK